MSEQRHSLAEVLTFLMEECDIDDASLSRQTDVPASSISRMRLSPDANPTASTLRPMAKFFDVSISQLLGDEPLSAERLPGTHNPIEVTSSLIPLIEWGDITDWVLKEVLQKKVIPWLSSEHIVSKKAFALTIPTESYGLFLRKGSIVLIDPEKNLRDGDIILLKSVNEQTTLLKQILIDGNIKYIKSVNPEIKGTEQLTEAYEILGVVFEMRFPLHESSSSSVQKPSASSVLELVSAKAGIQLS